MAICSSFATQFLETAPVYRRTERLVNRWRSFSSPTPPHRSLMPSSLSCSLQCCYVAGPGGFVALAGPSRRFSRAGGGSLDGRHRSCPGEADAERAQGPSRRGGRRGSPPAPSQSPRRPAIGLRTRIDDLVAAVVRFHAIDGAADLVVLVAANRLAKVFLDLVDFPKPASCSIWGWQGCTLAWNG
jgi:hypothetical protein